MRHGRWGSASMDDSGSQKVHVVGIVEFDILRRGIRRFPRRTSDGRRTWDPQGTGRAEGDRWKSQRWPGVRAIAEALALQ